MGNMIIVYIFKIIFLIFSLEPPKPLGIFLVDDENIYKW